MIDVIGGGVVGLCSAYYLTKAGYEVTVYDPGEGPRTSMINAGMIVPSHLIPLASPGMVGLGLRMMLRPGSPFGIRPRPSRELLRWFALFARHCTKAHVDRSKSLLKQLHIGSRELYLELQRDLPGFQVEERGLLMIARTAGTLEKERHLVQEVRDLGLPATILDRGEVADFDSGVKIAAAGGIYFPLDAHFHPGEFMTLLESRLVDMGVRFVSNRADLNFLENRTVLAAGVWSGELAQEVGLVLPLQAGKGYSFDLPAAPRRPRIAAILIEDRVAVTPMPVGVRFSGTMEIGPVDDRIDRRRVEGIRRAIPSYYPEFRGVDMSHSRVELGLRPCSPDGLPYIGIPRGQPNLIIATGHAMMGMSLGPITGKLVADLVSGEPPPIDISILAPDRFGGRDARAPTRGKFKV